MNTYIENIIEEIPYNNSNQITFEDIIKQDLIKYKGKNIKNKKKFKVIINNEELKKENKLFYYYNILGFLKKED